MAERRRNEVKTSQSQSTPRPPSRMRAMHPPTAALDGGECDSATLRLCAASPSRVEQVINVNVAVRAIITTKGCCAGSWEMSPTHIVINH